MKKKKLKIKREVIRNLDFETLVNGGTCSAPCTAHSVCDCPSLEVFCLPNYTCQAGCWPHH